MGFLTFRRRGLGGSIVFAPPAPPSANYHDILDAAVTRKHLPLNDASPSTAASNRGATAGNGTYVNVAGIRYSLGKLIAGDPSAMRSIALSGATTSPPHITIANLVTLKSWTIDIALQLDRHTTKMVVVTQGLPQATAGGVSIEVESDGASGMRARCWTSIGGVARVMTTGAGSVPIGPGFKLTYRQEEGVGRRVYIDGIQIASDTSFTAFENTPTGTWYIGAWSDGSSPFDGLMAELASWNTAVAAATIASLGARAQDVLELAAIPAQEFVASTSGSLGVVALGVANPDVNWTVEVVSAGLNSSLTAFTASGQSVNWTTGATAGSASPTIRLTRDGGAMVSATRTVSITVTATAPPPSGTTCYSGSGGTVQAPSFTDRETELFLSGGGNTRYNLSSSSFRIRWLNSGGGDPRRADTTDLLCYRLQPPHNGGCISRGLVVGNILASDHRDSGTPWAGKDFQLYPRSHGGHYYLASTTANPIRNIAIEFCRSHATWDPYRIVGDAVSHSTQNITIRDNWDTLVRDDWLENDSPSRDIFIEDNLVGDTITGDNNNARGCWSFLSSQHTGPAEDRAGHVWVERNLVWNSQQYAPSRPRALNGYALGSIFKMGLAICPRHHLIDNFFVVDHANIGSNNGDPLLTVKPGSSNPGIIGTVSGQSGESSGNIIYYRDLANAGKYAYQASSPVWTLPPGFTLIMGNEGEQEWNQRVAAWKAAHPLVRRIVNKSMPRPVGGNITINDVG